MIASYVAPCILYSVISQAGVTGAHLVSDHRMTEIFFYVDEQKIGMAVEPIPGKTAFLGDKLHFRWERAQHV
jgi:hypothetical protein